jgi:hypothetical protein
MAIKNQAIVICYTAWNTSAAQGQASDAANHTLRAIVDGVGQAVTGTPAEVDPTNAKGEYAVTLTTGNMNGDFVKFCGASSTANVVIIPIPIATERGLVSALNSAAQLAAGLALTGVVASSPAPSASAFTVTLDAALSGLETADDLAGLYCTFRSGGRQARALPIAGCAILSTTSVSLTFAAPNLFAAAPAAGDAATISS